MKSTLPGWVPGWVPLGPGRAHGQQPGAGRHHRGRGSPKRRGRGEEAPDGCFSPMKYGIYLWILYGIC